MAKTTMAWQMYGDDAAILEAALGGNIPGGALFKEWTVVSNMSINPSPTLIFGRNDGVNTLGQTLSIESAYGDPNPWWSMPDIVP